VIAIFVIAIVLCALTADYVVQRLQLLASEAPAPLGLDYVDDRHMAVRVEPTGLVKIGLDEVAGLLLGRPDRIEWTHGGQVVAGAPLATLHRRGRKIVMRSPIDGLVMQEKDPEPLAKARPGSEQPSASWLLRVRPAQLRGQLDRMRSGEVLRRWMREEMDRLRDTIVARAPHLTGVGATALDGGPPAPEIADALGDAAFCETVRDLLGDEALVDEPSDTPSNQERLS
jgi:hypothetical protein